MPKSKCPTKWKRVHETEASAERHLALLFKQGKGRGMKVYPCPGGHWHVGSGHVHGRAGKAKRVRRR